MIPSLHHFRILALAILCSAVGCLTVEAADSKLQVDGKVASASSSSISLTLKKTGQTETFVVTETTRILRDRQPITTEDIQAGEVAVVSGHKDNGMQYADTIYLKAQH